MKKIRFVVLIPLVFCGCATSPDTTAWNVVKEVNTPAAYDDALRCYLRAAT